MTLVHTPPSVAVPPPGFDPSQASPALSGPALQAPARAVPAPNATLLSREDVTDSMAAFTVALDEPLKAFRPGQYLSLGLIADGALIQRPYSIVALDGSGDRVELFIRRVPQGALSGRLWALPMGARVRVGQPKGLFVLDEEDERPRLFIGTGTGLAPLLAMLEAVAERGHDTATNVLVHGVSYRDELAYGYRICSWMATGMPLIYRPTLSRADDPRNAGWRGYSGRADTAVARLLEEMPMLRGAARTCAATAPWSTRARSCWRTQAFPARTFGPSSSTRRHLAPLRLRPEC
jgi:ferredoxin-NADP reductase